jgi:hypothetical protein
LAVEVDEPDCPRAVGDSRGCDVAERRSPQVGHLARVCRAVVGEYDHEDTRVHLDRGRHEPIGEPQPDQVLCGEGNEHGETGDGRDPDRRGTS